MSGERIFCGSTIPVGRLVAKTRSNNDDWEPPPALDDTEYAAYCLVIALSVMCQGLNKGEAYNVVLQWFVDGMSEETAEYYGSILSKLVNQARSSGTFH